MTTPTSPIWVLTFCLLPGCYQADAVEQVAHSSEAVTWDQCAVFGTDNPTNDQITFNYFVGKGLSAVQAAGIVGTFDGESGNNPASSAGSSRGIAQWQVGGRWDTGGAAPEDNLVAFAQSTGRAGQEATLAVQLDFVWFELSTYPVFGLANLKQTTTVADATNVFIRDFEMAGGEDPDGPHVCWAQWAYQTWGSGSPPQDAGTPNDSGGQPPASADAATQSTGSGDDGCSVRRRESSGSLGWFGLMSLAMAVLLRRKMRAARRR